LFKFELICFKSSFSRQNLPPHAERQQVDLLRQPDRHERVLQSNSDLQKAFEGSDAHHEMILLRLNATKLSDDVQVGEGAVSWKHDGVSLHVLERN
jgi:hypothetical protein